MLHVPLQTRFLSYFLDFTGHLVESTENLLTN